MLVAQTPVTLCSPCYSAVSASLMNPLPDYSNYSPFCHTDYLNTSLISWARPFTKPLCWRLLLLLRRFTAESSWELMSLEEYCSALGMLNIKHRQVVMFLLLLFKLASQLPFVSFPFFTISILSLLPYSILSAPLLNPLSSPFPHSTSLSTIPSFSSGRFSDLLR